MPATVLVTGMSGTGKSAALEELERRGYAVVETDDAPWSETVAGPDGLEQLWREDRIAELLAGARDTPLFVSGCVRNQDRFYDRFDAVVLLSAPADVLLERIAARTGNQFGKAPDERSRILHDLAWAEPLIRETCTHELDATGTVGEIVDALVAIARRVASRRDAAV